MGEAVKMRKCSFAFGVVKVAFGVVKTALGVVTTSFKVPSMGSWWELYISIYLYNRYRASNSPYMNCES